MIYNITKIYNKRHLTEYVILTQIRNLFEIDTYIEPYLKLGSADYTWKKWQEYFYRKNKHRQLPCHYFIEQTLDDFDIHVGLPEYAPSYFLQELFQLGIIDNKYKDAILIAIGEDFNLENAEARMYEQLCSKLLVPLILRNRKYMQQENIKYIDDILSFEAYKLHFENKRILYDISRGLHFNEFNLNRYIRKHIANIRLT